MWGGEWGRWATQNGKEMSCWPYRMGGAGFVIYFVYSADFDAFGLFRPRRERRLVRVCHYLELEPWIERSGIGVAANNQRRALDDVHSDVAIRTSPWYRGSLPRALAGSLDGRPIGPADADVIHCNSIGPGAFALSEYARRRDVPLVIGAHVTREDFAESFRGSTAASRPLGRYLRRFYSRADLVCAPTDYTQRVLEGYPIDAPIRTVTNGVDLDSLSGFEGLRDAYRERYDLSGTVVFALGHVFERKGVTEFCELARRTEYDFVWFGQYATGPLASRTVRRVTRNPPDNVRFTGWIDDKRGAFAAGDVFCLPTRVENQCIAALEAMACGKPVVLRDLPVFRELYTDGVDCLLCSTIEEFREALDRLADDPVLRERLGANARRTARRHRLELVGEELLDCYRTVTSEGH